jgi:hypothetical protein
MINKKQIFGFMLLFASASLLYYYVVLAKNNTYVEATVAHEEVSNEIWDDTFPETSEEEATNTITNSSIMGDKWIVVTTINYPTEAVKKLANIEGWKVVVVGDKKTPKDWNYTNCIYLSIEKQKELGYKIHDLLPYGHYGRKNIGYIFAVQHGARVIYETDDDNMLIRSDLSTFLPETAVVCKYNTGLMLNIDR